MPQDSRPMKKISSMPTRIAASRGRQPATSATPIVVSSAIRRGARSAAGPAPMRPYDAVWRANSATSSALRHPAAMKMPPRASRAACPAKRQARGLSGTEVDESTVQDPVRIVGRFEPADGVPPGTEMLLPAGPVELAQAGQVAHGPGAHAHLGGHLER